MMIYKSIADIAQAGLEVTQSAVVPMLGVCLAVAVVFLIMQVVLSVQDFNFQFLVRLVLLGLVCVFMAKSVSEKFIAFSKSVFESAPGLVR